MWLYILLPLQSATLIIAFGLIVQGYSVWKLRRAIGRTYFNLDQSPYVRTGTGAFLD